MVSPPARIRFLLNDQDVDTDDPAGLPVLDWLRRQRRLTGTKEGCKEGDCGACVVLIGDRASPGGLAYRPVTSCLVPLGELNGKHLVTIEGLNLPDARLTPIQQAIVEEGGAQCGYCTSGIIVSMTHCLMEYREAADPDRMKDALSGHLCRCTGYGSLKRAALRVRGAVPAAATLEEALPGLISRGILPGYFEDIPKRLRVLKTESPTWPGGMAFPIAGGTDLYVQHGEGVSRSRVRLLNLEPGMDEVVAEPGSLRVGALTTFEAFGRIPQIREWIPRIDEYLHHVASLQIRHRATLGGNVVNASPVGDLTLLLLALEADVCLRAPNGERTLPLHELYLGYKQLSLREDELIAEFAIPLASGDVRIHFEKISKRTCLDIASVNTAIKLRMEGETIQSAVLAMGGVAPIPMLMGEVSAWLIGKSVTTSLVQDLQDRVAREISPIDDVRGSADYKRLLARRLVAAHFIELFPDQVKPEAFV